MLVCNKGTGTKNVQYSSVYQLGANSNVILVFVVHVGGICAMSD